MIGRGRAIVLMVVATTLWGASSAFLAEVSVPGIGAAGPVAFGGALLLLGVAMIRGERPWRVFRADRRLFLCLGGLETANLVFYVAALRLGPLPVVVALHLTAPMILIVSQVVRGRRALGLAVVTEVTLVGVAIGLVAIGRTDSKDTIAIVVGCVLALASAACAAGLVTLVAEHSAQRATLASAGLQLLLATLLALPLTIAAAPPTGWAVIQLVAVGALLLGPGFACYWWALRTLDATTAGIVGLNEAVAAAIIGAVLTDTRLTVATVAAGGMVLTAVAVQVRTDTAFDERRRRRPRTPSRPYLRSRSRPRC
ncbi:EamA family transporter [Nocardia otitidiscaviarum]|uniref:EamA family transporter n=1 Tax=Nocardia otitidiscaviarum TaxID=1823 RepID=UPI002456B55F|nr:EamA family transporter [Nocardia otitidiscaviarum]